MLDFSKEGLGLFDWKGDLAPFVTYDVLYIGQCIKEPLTKRFKAHHALQNMLIEEKVISSSYDKADELILIPLTINSNVLSYITSDTPEKEWQKAVHNSYDFGRNEIVLDAEKAFVHNMNPKYNKIKFNKYPQSIDGLYNTDANMVAYSVLEYARFRYDEGIIIGCPDNHFASKIVGDDEGFTKVYSPEEDYTEKFFQRVMV